MKDTRLVITLSAALLLAVTFGLGSDATGVRAEDSVTAAATPTVTPTPVVKPTLSPSPTPGGPRGQTIEQLKSRISQKLFSPEVRRGRVGVKVVSLASGKVVFENDADKYFMPASNMKNFTVAAALERLTPDFRFVTSVYADAAPSGDGTIKGPLRIFGRGDISISTSFWNDDPYKGLDDLAEKIKAAGIKRVEGDLIGDESYFKGSAIPVTWEWNDLQWYYGTEISALPLNDNVVNLSVRPGPTGYQCSVRITPVNPVIQVQNRCTSGGPKNTLQITKKLDRNILEVSGSLPAGDLGFDGRVAVSHPAELFVALLKQRLELKGVVVTGSAWTTGSRPDPPQTQSPPVEVARMESPPLSFIAAKTMKPSQNMYTETLLWTLGEQVRRQAAPFGDSSSLGLSVVEEFLKRAGIPDGGIVQHDGSGLSRHNLITPSAVTALYVYMAKQSRFAQAWRDCLAVGGVDGTLGRRFKGTAAAGNFRGKTGTIDQVSALSGYVTTAGGEQLVVSMVVNGVPEQGARTALIDDIAVSLANFNGRIDQ